MICNKCGAVNPEEEKVCVSCGESFEKKPVDDAEKKETKTDKVLFYVKNGLALLSLLFALVGTLVVGGRMKVAGVVVNITLLNNYSALFGSSASKIIMETMQILSFVALALLLVSSSLVFALKKKRVCGFALAGMLAFVAELAFFSSVFSTATGTELTLNSSTVAMLSLCFLFSAGSFVLEEISCARKGNKGIVTRAFGGGSVFITAIALLAFGFYATVDVDGIIYGACAVFEKAPSDGYAIATLTVLVAGISGLLLSGILKIFDKNTASATLSFVSIVLQIATFVFCQTALGSQCKDVAVSYIISIIISFFAFAVNITHRTLAENVVSTADGEKSIGAKVFFSLKNCSALVVGALAFAGSFVIGCSITESGTVTRKLLLDNWAFFSPDYEIRVVTEVLQILCITATFATVLTATLLFLFKNKNASKCAVASLVIYAIPLTLFLSNFDKPDGTKVALSSETLSISVLCFVLTATVVVASCVQKILNDKKELKSQILKCFTLLMLCVSLILFGLPAIKSTIQATSASDKVNVNSGIMASFYLTQRVLSDWSLSLCIAGIFLTAVSAVLKNADKDGASLITDIVAVAFQIIALILMYVGVSETFGGYDYYYGLSDAYYHWVTVSAGYIVGICVSAVALVLNTVHVVTKRKTAESDKLLGK